MYLNPFRLLRIIRTYRTKLHKQIEIKCKIAKIANLKEFLKVSILPFLYMMLKVIISHSN